MVIVTETVVTRIHFTDLVHVHELFTEIKDDLTRDRQVTYKVHIFTKVKHVKVSSIFINSTFLNRDLNHVTYLSKELVYLDVQRTLRVSTVIVEKEKV